MAIKSFREEFIIRAREGIKGVHVLLHAAVFCGCGAVSGVGHVHAQFEDSFFEGIGVMQIISVTPQHNSLSSDECVHSVLGVLVMSK